MDFAYNFHRPINYTALIKRTPIVGVFRWIFTSKCTNCFVKKLFLKIHRKHKVRKTPVPESLL